MAVSVDPDQRLRFAASVLGLHCLMRPISANTKAKYGVRFQLLAKTGKHFINYFIHHTQIEQG